MQPSPPRIDTVTRLAALCRGEISAYETYKQALASGILSAFVEDLMVCLNSHQRRAELLRQQILALGGLPPSSSGAWGAFAKVIEGAATLLGRKAALAALEEGEDHGLKEYRESTQRLDTGFQAWVSTQLMPQQVATHRIVSALKHGMA